MKRINSIIITNMSDLCKWLNHEGIGKEHARIVNMKPVKGVAGEDVIKLEYYYEDQED